MIPRYTHPEMGHIWSDEHRYRTWLRVEIAAAEAMAARGIIPMQAATAIRERGAFDVARIDEIELVTKHDIIAFTQAVAEHVGPDARWLHFGLTSSDVLDTALALQLRDACDLILKRIDALRGAVKRRAEEHRRTPIIGRTHGVHAEPTTFGLKLALWFAELGRDADRVRRGRDVVSVGKMSGAVGTYAHLEPGIEADVCASLGLVPAPVSSQVVQRDRHAELMSALAITGASLEKFALEIRGLQKTEIGEVEEPFDHGQKGSSAMPHKRNPIACEQVVGLSRVLRGNLGAAIEDIALWHERDISHSSTERVIFPDACIGLDYMMHILIGVLDGLEVRTQRLHDNLYATQGVLASEKVLHALIERGWTREDSYSKVQACAKTALAESTPFLEVLLRDDAVAKILGREQLETMMMLEPRYEYTDKILKRLNIID